MRGRKPLPLRIAPHDVSTLHQIAHSRSLPWFQVQRARIVLGVAAGEPIHQLAIRTQCDRSTIWRTCRRYKDTGLPGLLARPEGPGRPARISPPPARADRRVGLLGADRSWPAHHSLDEPGPGPPS
ncbi:MAG: helix-turn-helix domain-containing protein, partial [Isosphaeraceae bacterium]